jgi:protein tyrosine/serine phosphatase
VNKAKIIRRKAMQLLPLEKGINFRDMGRIPTKSGAKIKTGVLFRSGMLSNLSANDCQFLADNIGLKSILDYRDKSEIEKNPDRLWSGVNYYAIAANPLNGDVSANIIEDVKANSHDHRSGSAFMIKLYEQLPFNNPAYKQLVSLLLAPELTPMVQHCAVGKDRTGVGCALTQLALGVDEETVMQDYLLTEKTLAPFSEAFLAKLAPTVSSAEFAFQQALFATKEAYLLSALRAIKKRYQTIDRWLELDYGLTFAKREQLQHKYLL